MAKILKVLLEDKPGALARMGEALGLAGINIDGICGMTVAGEGVIFVLVEDIDAAKKVLEVKQIKVAGEQEVLVIEVEDRPGVLGNIARRLAHAGVNVNLAFMAMTTKLVVGVDDLVKARAAI